MNGSPYVLRTEFDQHRGAVLRDLGQAKRTAESAVEQVQSIRSAVIEKIDQLRAELGGKIDAVHDELDEFKERSSVTALDELKRQKRLLEEQLEKRESRSEKRIDWVVTAIVGFLTTAAGSVVTWWLSHH